MHAARWHARQRLVRVVVPELPPPPRPRDRSHPQMVANWSSIRPIVCASPQMVASASENLLFLS